MPRWRFSPAKKGGQPAPTWVTYGIELAVSLEKAVFTAFTLEPVRKDDPLVATLPDTAGDAWMARYPREIDPKDAALVSIEDVDVLPSPEKTPWSLDASRARAPRDRSRRGFQSRARSAAFFRRARRSLSSRALAERVRREVAFHAGRFGRPTRLVLDGARRRARLHARLGEEEE